MVSSYTTRKEKYQKAQTKLEWTQDAWKSLNTKVYSLYSNISVSYTHLFEAAAFLKRSGAEVTRVRKMLRTDMACYKMCIRDRHRRTAPEGRQQKCDGTARQCAEKLL